MKIAVVYPIRPRWPKFAWVHQALGQMGYTVTHVRNSAELEAADKECDLILFEHKNAGLPIPDIISIGREHKAQWVQWWFDLVFVDDLPLTEGERRHLVDVMRTMDVCCVKEMSKLKDLHDIGIPAVYTDQGCPSWWPQSRVKAEVDVIMCGRSARHYVERREDVEELVRCGYSVGWACHNTDHLPKHVRRYPWQVGERLIDNFSLGKVVLSCGKRNDEPGYRSDGIWLALGAGCAVVKRWTPGMPEGPYESYESSPVPAVRRLLNSESRRNRFRKEAREWVMERHTIEHRLRSILKSVASSVKEPALSC